MWHVLVMRPADSSIRSVGTQHNEAIRNEFVGQKKHPANQKLDLLFGNWPLWQRSLLVRFIILWLILASVKGDRHDAI